MKTLRTRWIAAAALLTACASATQPAATASWAIAQRIVLPTGAALQPDNASQPGIAASSALTWASGTVYVVLANLNPNTYLPAGPSWVAAYDDTTLAQQKMVPLQLGSESGQVSCTNAGAITSDGDDLYVACAGLIATDPTQPTADGVLIDYSISQQAVRAATVVGRSPGSAIQVGEIVWMGDLDTPTLLGFDVESNTVVAGIGGETPPQICQSGFVSALAAIDGRLFASCFNDDTIQELNPLTGAKIGAALATGDGPVSLATFPDRIVISDSLSGTLSFLFPTTPATVQRMAVRADGEQGGDDLEGLAGNGTWAAVADSGFSTLVLFSVPEGYKLVDAVSMKDTPTQPSNDPYGVAFGNGAFFVAVSGWSEPGELIRVVDTSP